MDKLTYFVEQKQETGWSRAVRKQYKTLKYSTARAQKDANRKDKEYRVISEYGDVVYSAVPTRKLFEDVS